MLFKKHSVVTNSSSLCKSSNGISQNQKASFSCLIVLDLRSVGMLVEFLLLNVIYVHNF